MCEKICEVNMIEVLTKHEELTAQIMEYKNKNFPRGTIVYVNALAYQGYGIVNVGRHSENRYLEVYISNGNTWRYNLLYCKKFEGNIKENEFLISFKLQFYGFKRIKVNNGFKKWSNHVTNSLHSFKKEN